MLPISVTDPLFSAVLVRVSPKRLLPLTVTQHSRELLKCQWPTKKGALWSVSHADSSLGFVTYWRQILTCRLWWQWWEGHRKVTMVVNGKALTPPGWNLPCSSNETIPSCFDTVSNPYTSFSPTHYHQDHDDCQRVTSPAWSVFSSSVCCHLQQYPEQMDGLARGSLTSSYNSVTLFEAHGSSVTLF